VQVTSLSTKRFGLDIGRLGAIIQHGTRHAEFSLGWVYDVYLSHGAAEVQGSESNYRVVECSPAREILSFLERE